MIFFLINGVATAAFLLSTAAVRLAWPTAPELPAGAVFTGRRLRGRPRAALHCRDRFPVIGYWT
jgi:hypothetical protein